MFFLDDLPKAVKKIIFLTISNWQFSIMPVNDESSRVDIVELKNIVP